MKRTLTASILILSVFSGFWAANAQQRRFEDKPTLFLHLVRASDVGRGPKYDQDSEALSGALGGINRRYFRYVRGVPYTVTPGRPININLPVGEARITLGNEESGRFPIEVLWTQDQPGGAGKTTIAQVSHSLSPGRMLTIGGPAFEEGNLCMVLQVAPPEPSVSQVPPSPVPPPTQTPLPTREFRGGDGGTRRSPGTSREITEEEPSEPKPERTRPPEGPPTGSRRGMPSRGE